MGEPGKEEEIPLLSLTLVRGATIVGKKEAKVGKGGKKGKRCILVVGSTGNGKTSTINIYTGAKEEVGDSVRSETQVTKTVEDIKHPGGVPWVDNPGWADTGGKSDNQTVKDLLKHLAKENFQFVDAVVWCVSPNERMDKTLQTQAKLIDMLTQDQDWGKIWSNVIILCKGKLRKTAKEDCVGAEMAAKEICRTASPRSLGYQFAEEEHMTDFKPDVRKKYRLLTKQEVLEQLEQEISELPEPVQVVFSNKKCKACGQTGDPRLMDDKCHRTMVLGHRGPLREKKKHSRPLIGAAYAVGTVGVVGLATASALVPGSELLLIGVSIQCWWLPAANIIFSQVPMCMGPGSGMALRRAFANPDMKWKCCKREGVMGEDGSYDRQVNGCTQKCDNCDQPWGSGEPCVAIRLPDQGLQEQLGDYQFVKKDHDLEDIQI